MPLDRSKVEQRRLRLVTAIAVLEEQDVAFSRETTAFLDWAKRELRFVDTLLRQEELLAQLKLYQAATRGRTAEHGTLQDDVGENSALAPLASGIAAANDATTRPPRDAAREHSKEVRHQPG